MGKRDLHYANPLCRERQKKTVQTRALLSNRLKKTNYMRWGTNICSIYYIVIHQERLKWFFTKFLIYIFIRRLPRRILFQCYCKNKTPQHSQYQLWFMHCKNHLFLTRMDRLIITMIPNHIHMELQNPTNRLWYIYI